ncbi:MAG: hypothetical protein ACRCV9_04035 [Burkholderiaceae bacterium]
MARFAQRLPVAPAPEQQEVTAMRNYVIDNRRRNQLAALLMKIAQRIRSKERLSCGLPLASIQLVVSTFIGHEAKSPATFRPGL